LFYCRSSPIFEVDPIGSEPDGWNNYPVRN
jgi:hypothetical protein